MLSTLRRPIVNIFSVLKHFMSFLARMQLKFVNSETTIKFDSNFIKNSERGVNGISYMVYEISFESS